MCRLYQAGSHKKANITGNIWLYVATPVGLRVHTAEHTEVYVALCTIQEKDRTNGT